MKELRELLNKFFRGPKGERFDQHFEEFYAHEADETLPSVDPTLDDVPNGWEEGLKPDLSVPPNLRGNVCSGIKTLDQRLGKSDR